MFRSTRRSAVSCVISSTSSVLPFPRCSRAGLRTISPPTSCCENAISLPALASFYLAPSNGSPSGAGPDWQNSKDFAWLVARIRSGPPIGFFRIGWVRSLANLNEFFVHHEDVRRANGLGPRTPHACNGCCLVAKRSPRQPLPESAAPRCRARDRLGRNRRAGDGSTRRADCSTQRCAGRTAPVRLRAPSCSAGRGQRTAGGCRGDASHTLRHVSATLYFDPETIAAVYRLTCEKPT